MKECKCPNCGAGISIDENKEVNKCQYCNTSFETEKAILSGTTNNNNAQVINYYYSTPANNKNSTNLKVAPPRPKLNGFLAFILFCFYIFPGIIYVVSVKNAQKEWDDKYTY